MKKKVQTEEKAQCEATGIAQSRTKTLNLGNGRATQGVRIEQEPSAIPDRCRSMGARIWEPLR